MDREIASTSGEASTASRGLPSVTLAVVTLRRPDTLTRMLESVAASSRLPDEVIVVDGDDAGSAEPVVRSFADRFENVECLRSPRGITRQRNVALRRARGEVIVFLDDDVELARDMLQELLAAYEDPTVIGAAGRILEPKSHRIGGKQAVFRRWLPGGVRHQGTFTRFGYPRYLLDVDRARDVEFMQGCFMSARSEHARAVGFDEHLAEYALGEDEDFSYRLSRRGRIRYVPRALIRHEKQGFLEQDATVAFGRAVSENRTYLFRKNFHPTPAAWLQFAGLIALLVVHRILNRDLAGARGLVVGAIRGVLARP